MLDIFFLGGLILNIYFVTSFIYLLESISQKSLPLLVLGVINLSILAAFIYKVVENLKLENI